MEKHNGITEDLGAEIGYTATALLVDWFGGGKLCVPAVAEDSHPIAKVIGMSAYRLLVAAYGGKEPFRLPMGYEREMNRRDRMIGALFELGVGQKQIASIAGMSETHVRSVRVRLEEQGLIPFVLRRAGMGDVSKYTPYRKQVGQGGDRGRVKRRIK